MRQSTAAVCLAVLFFAICIWCVYRMETDPVLKAQRAKHQYEQRFPCIDGIRYIRSGRDAKESLTEKIDRQTLLPERCGAEQQ